MHVGVRVMLQISWLGWGILGSELRVILLGLLLHIIIGSSGQGPLIFVPICWRILTWGQSFIHFEKLYMLQGLGNNLVLLDIVVVVDFDTRSSFRLCGL